MKRVNDRDFELLSAYIDDELSNEERSVLEQRLQSEDDLRRELELLRATVSLIGSLPVLKAPRDYALTAPPRAVTPKISMFPRLLSVASAAAAVLLFAVGIGLLNTGSTTQPLANTAARDVAVLPSATQIAAITALTSTPLPTLSPILGQLDYAIEAPTEPEAQMQIAAPVEDTASGLPSAAITAPTDEDFADGELADMFESSTLAQESVGMSAGALAPETGNAANAVIEKTPTPAPTIMAEFAAQATQPPSPTTSPVPTRTSTIEIPTQVAQNATRVEPSATEILETDAQEEGTDERVAQANNSTTALAVALLVGGVLLMAVAIVIFARSRRTP